MESRVRVILVAVILILFLVLIIFGIYWLLSNAKKINLNSGNADTLSKLPVLTTVPTQALGQNQTQTNNTQPQITISQPVLGTNTKIFQGASFSFSYPQNWGLLTCRNSENIELDPVSANDLKNYNCQTAVKAVTILVSNQPLICSGSAQTKGGVSFNKSVKQTANFLSYHWCLKVGNKYLDISHRVAPSGIATSITDYSKEIEEMISTIKY